MFHTAIAGVTGDPSDADVISLARRLSSPLARLIAVGVVAPGDRHPDAAAIVGEVAAAHPGFEPRLVFADSAAHGLHAAAREHGADLIVVGVDHGGALDRIVHGSNCKATLHDAPCPVAIAPKGYARHDRPFTRVGIGYDGSAQADAAIELARAIGRDHGAELRAMTVVEIPKTPVGVGYAPSVLESRVRAAGRALEDIEHVTGEVVVGLVPQELARLSRDVDLLVLGAHGHSSIARAVFGSTSDAMAGHARLPLVVIPPRKAQVVV